MVDDEFFMLVMGERWMENVKSFMTVPVSYCSLKQYILFHYELNFLSVKLGHNSLRKWLQNDFSLLSQL